MIESDTVASSMVLCVGSSFQTDRKRQRVAVVGGGLAGLAATILLAEDGRWDVSLFERNAIFGGRAAVDPKKGEHCPRLMLSDYSLTYELLSRIPGNDSDATVLDSLTRVCRMEKGSGGHWIELDHINRFKASRLSFHDHVAIYWQARHRPLVAATYGPNRNVLGHWRQYSIASLIQITRNIWQADKIFAFPGSTAVFLIEPMLNHLSRSGVKLYSSTGISRLIVNDRPAGNYDDCFDAVVLALFPTDLSQLLNASCIYNTLPTLLRHAHCKVLTVTLDPCEAVLADMRPQLFCSAGLAALVQPEESRCVVLCTRVVSTDDDYVLNLVRSFLSLKYPFGRVLVRDNRLPGEAVWSATMPKAPVVLPVRPRGVHLAGSWLASGYPYDSAESAIRSAHLAVAQINAEFESVFRRV